LALRLHTKIGGWKSSQLFRYNSRLALNGNPLSVIVVGMPRATVWIALACFCLLLPAFSRRLGILIDFDISGGIAAWRLIQHEKKP
jgi:hypothetical protein